VGVVAHVIVRVDVGLVPIHPALPVTVNVAVKLPNVALGVNVAKAGFAFCDQVPVPPIHVLPLFVPPDAAPVIVIAAVPVQVEILVPAEAVGVALMVRVFVEVALEHGEFPVAVKVKVTLAAVMSAGLGV